MSTKFVQTYANVPIQKSSENVYKKTTITLILIGVSVFLISLSILPVNFFIENDWDLCLFHHFLGIECPGCGTLRALSALMHGQFGLAWEYNPLSYFWVAMFLATTSWVFLTRTINKYHVTSRTFN